MKWIDKPYEPRTDRKPHCPRCGRRHTQYPVPRCKIRPKKKFFGKREHNGVKAYAPYGYNTTIRKFGHLLTWNEMNWKERHVTMLRIKGARKRNRYWKLHGYPNLKKGTQVLLANRAAKLKAGIAPKRRTRRLEKIVNQGIPASSPDEARAAELWLSGKIERVERHRATVLLGDILPAGSYDPAYLMRREMRILDVMSRCPT